MDSPKSFWNDSRLMTELCHVRAAAREKMPPAFADKSGSGAHYTDTFTEL